MTVLHGWAFVTVTAQGTWQVPKVLSDFSATEASLDYHAAQHHAHLVTRKTSEVRQILDSYSLPPSKSDGSVFLLLSLRRVYLRLANQNMAAETATVVTLSDLSTVY